MIQYLLDTCICVYFLRGRLNLDAKIREKGLENFFISEITLFELMYGAENSLNPAKSKEAVNQFVGGLKVIPIISCLTEYAAIKVRLRKNGTPMHDEFDLLIGVTALSNGLTLVTENEKDFRFLEEVKVENWKG